MIKQNKVKLDLDESNNNILGINTNKKCFHISESYDKTEQSKTLFSNIRDLQESNKSIQWINADNQKQIY